VIRRRWRCRDLELWIRRRELRVDPQRDDGYAPVRNAMLDRSGMRPALRDYLVRALEPGPHPAHGAVFALGGVERRRVIRGNADGNAEAAAAGEGDRRPQARAIPADGCVKCTTTTSGRRSRQRRRRKRPCCSEISCAVNPHDRVSGSVKARRRKKRPPGSSRISVSGKTRGRGRAPAARRDSMLFTRGSTR